MSAPFINHNDPSVSGPPLNRYQPIQPPIQAPSIQLFGTAPGPRSSYDPFGVNGGGSSGGGQYQPFGGKAYSLWSNLPGIDLGLGASLWQNTTSGGGHSSGLHMSGGGAERRSSAVFGGGDVSSYQQGGGTALSSSTSSLDPVVGYSSGGGGSKMPPPGFGLGGSTGDLSQAKGRSYQPFGAIGPASAAVGSGGGGTDGGYNPLQTQAATGAGTVGGAAGRAPPPGMTLQYRPQQLSGIGL